MQYGPTTSWQKDGETMEAVTKILFLRFQNQCEW